MTKEYTKKNPNKIQLNSLGLLTVCIFSILTANLGFAAPPFYGTAYSIPDIIKPTDPSTFTGITSLGVESRFMYDRRIPGWAMIDAYLFEVTYSDGDSCIAQVNVEFETESSALKIAEKYARHVGQLPIVLRSDIYELWIHKGRNAWGGGNRSILIHTGDETNNGEYASLEETLVHEAVHTSIDSYHATAPGWINAQNQDDEFISKYAQDFPGREDLAESFLAWMAVRYRPDRITEAQKEAILTSIPARLSYFDSQNFSMAPQETLDHYKLVNVNSNKALSVSGNSAEDKAYFVQWSDNGWRNQKFRVSRTSDGFYKFGLLYGNNKTLTVASESTDPANATNNWVRGGTGKSMNAANATKHWVWNDTGTDSQKFSLEMLGDGNTIIRSKLNNKAVGVADKSLLNGVDITLWDYSGDSNQQWKMTHVGSQIDGDNFFSQPYTGIRNNFEGWVGYEFTPSVDLTIDALGRPVSGNVEQNHGVRIWQVSDQKLIAEQVIKPESPVDAYGYANEKLDAPVTLRAGATYRIASYEKVGGDSWRDIGSLSNHSSVATIHKGIYGSDYWLYPTGVYWANGTGYAAPTFYYEE